MKKIIGFLWGVSILIYLGILLVVYAYMPDAVAYQTDEMGNYKDFVSKDTFFYTLLVSFSVANAIFFIFRKTLEAANKPGSFLGSGDFKEVFLTWFVSFMLVVNIMFIFTTIFMGIFNNQDYLTLSRFGLLAYIGPSLVVIKLVVLIFLLGKRVSELSGKVTVDKS
jgi:hypothetical protein